jgi:hypothetical protein
MQTDVNLVRGAPNKNHFGPESSRLFKYSCKFGITTAKNGKFLRDLAVLDQEVPLNAIGLATAHFIALPRADVARADRSSRHCSNRILDIPDPGHPLRKFS